jgi:hypothetical protein
VNRLPSLSLPALRLAGCLLIGSVVGGCGGPAGPVRYDVKGTVLYDGQPVPAGEVALDPDGSQGNKGPGSIARIKDGRYQTEPGKGVLGGPYVVRIVGFDGVPVGDSSVGTGIFPQYQTKVEFPSRAASQDFHVPKAPAGTN